MKAKKIQEENQEDTPKGAPTNGYKNWQSWEQYEKLYFYNQKILESKKTVR
jgi:hypothetical protein